MSLENVRSNNIGGSIKTCDFFMSHRELLRCVSSRKRVRQKIVLLQIVQSLRNDNVKKVLWDVERTETAITATRIILSPFDVHLQVYRAFLLTLGTRSRNMIYFQISRGFQNGLIKQSIFRIGSISQKHRLSVLNHSLLLNFNQIPPWLYTTTDITSDFLERSLNTIILSMTQFGDSFPFQIYKSPSLRKYTLH